MKILGIFIGIFLITTLGNILMQRQKEARGISYLKNIL
jgi:hypothetical protein